MTTEAELMRKLEDWVAAQPTPPGLKEVLATRDGELFAAFVLKAFREAAAEAVAENERASRVRSAAMDSFGGDAHQAETFLRSPREELGGRQPLLEAVASEEGALGVLKLLAAMHLPQ